MLTTNIGINLGSQAWSELDAQMVINCRRMAHILLATWNVDFARVDERDKNEM